MLPLPGLDQRDEHIESIGFSSVALRHADDYDRLRICRARLRGMLCRLRPLGHLRDKDAAKTARLRAGEIPLFAPDLDRLVAVNMRERRLERGRCCV